MAAAETAGGAAGEAGSSAAASAAPTMIGDLLSVGQVNSFFSSSSSPSSRSSHNLSGARALLVNASSFKISENESVLPQTRVYFNYNYFNNVGASLGAPGTGFDVHRETFGAEYAMADNTMSIGLRLPILIQDGNVRGGSIDGIGDLSMVFKWAGLRDPDSGSAFGGGLVITAPTGRDLTLDDDTHRNPWFIQPYIGGQYNAESFYFLMFTAVIIPTESQLPTLFTNDIGVGYRIYQNCDGALSAIIPTIEGHLTAPINHRGADTPVVGFPDIYDVTAGCHFGLFNRAYLTLATSIPVTGPRPYDFELLAQLNFRW
jgi:hypothetical protein